jgi:hypothetical protein
MGIDLMESVVRAERIWIKGHRDLSEKWVQELISEDPTILGLGNLEFLQKEKIQPGAGRLDRLLQEEDSTKRYEVEIQLGSTDERHIIRTIEYWDIERKRYPQYEHCAVLIAEDITSRFLNVVSLFNGTIPLIAIQMQAMLVGESKFTIVFTTVVDELTRGLVDPDEPIDSEPKDRAYWEKKSSKTTLEIVDDLLSIVRDVDKNFDLKYNKHYIGLSKNRNVSNFVVFKPKKNFVKIELRLPKLNEIDMILEENEMDLMSYAPWGAYRIRLSKNDMSKKRDVISRLIKNAHQEWGFDSE